MFKERILWIIFGPRMDEFRGRLRKLHKEERHKLYVIFSKYDQVKENYISRAYSTNGAEDKHI
jgi:hypothetical protein